MTKFAKKFAYAAVLALATMMTAACGGNGPTGPDIPGITPTPTPVQHTTINVEVSQNNATIPLASIGDNRYEAHVVAGQSAWITIEPVVPSGVNVAYVRFSAPWAGVGESDICLGGCGTGEQEFLNIPAGRHKITIKVKETWPVDYEQTIAVFIVAS